jgi:uncharacterized protein YaaN involved in tellurite resistance
MADKKISETVSEITAQTTVPVPVALGEAVPLAPKDMPAAEAEELSRRAQAIAIQLQNSTGSKEMEVVDSISSLGLETQRKAASELALLKTRVGEMCATNGLTGRVTTDLVELRTALRQIAPPDMENTSAWDRLLALLPFRQTVLATLERIAVRYEPVSRQVAVIETRLRQGRLVLTRDNIELRKLYETVESQQLTIRRNTYFGELLMQELQKLLINASEPQKKEKIQGALYDVSMRVQDLRTMEEVHAQCFVSIEMTRQNNTRLAQAVERTLTLAANLVTVGLAIQVALARQARVIEATERTRQFLGDMIVANAETIKRHTQEIGDVYKDPVIAVEKISQAHAALLDAIDLADRLKQEGVASAQENISKLARLAGVLEARFSGGRELAVQKTLEA